MVGVEGGSAVMRRKNQEQTYGDHAVTWVISPSTLGKKAQICCESQQNRYKEQLRAGIVRACHMNSYVTSAEKRENIFSSGKVLAIPISEGTV
jgi:hypothetical protein